MKRDARQSRPQLVLVLADNSKSMSEGHKAEAATYGICEMICQCQLKSPPGKDCYRIALISFAMQPKLMLNMVPARQIDLEEVCIRGDGGGTNITGALEITYECLKHYMRSLDNHPERDRHPLPLVLLFSDGHNGHGKPEPVANAIKALNIDGWPVTIAAAGVATPGTKEPREELLRQIASEECYERIEDVQYLAEFIATVGSSGASSAREVSTLVRRMRRLRGQTAPQFDPLPEPPHAPLLPPGPEDPPNPSGAPGGSSRPYHPGIDD